MQPVDYVTAGLANGCAVRLRVHFASMAQLRIPFGPPLVIRIGL